MDLMLMKKIKYLLSFKVNENDNYKYLPLLENIFYEFIISMEENYNYDSNKNTYYNLLLNKLNHHIKSIIIPANNFYYHPLGFLELSTDLKNNLSKYEVTEKQDKMKEYIFKNNYFYQLLLVIKTTKTHIGFCSTNKNEVDKYGFNIGTSLFDDDKNSVLEKLFTEVEALTLNNNTFIKKNNYNIIYPDGTSYNYFLYLHNLDFNYIEAINMINIFVVVLGKTYIMDAEINDYKKFIDEFNDKYDELLGTIRFDINNNNKRIQTPWNYILDLVLAIATGKNNYRKMEYIKNLNLLLFKIYDIKLSNLLDKDLSIIETDILRKEIRVLEENMLYNQDSKLHKQMKHVILFNEIKRRVDTISNKSNSRDFSLKEYIVVNRKERKIFMSSFQPIKLNDKYISIIVKDNFDLEDKYFLKFDVKMYNFVDESTVVYSDLYLLIDKIKYLYASSELGVMTTESDLIRTSIAIRVTNPDIMNIIINDRYGFLGEFKYSDIEKKCVVYKNSNVIEYLKNKI